MSVKLADTLKPLGDFEVAESQDISIKLKDETSTSIQDAYDDGLLGGSGLPEPESKDKLLLSVENAETSELEWSQVDKSEVGDSAFKGTHDEWDALSEEEKAMFETVIFTDDYGEGVKGVGFIDTTNKIATFTGSCNWTATENCYLVINNYSASGISTNVTINDVIIYHLTSPNTPISSHYSFPIKKGDVVKATTYSSYKIDFYGMKY